MAAYAALLSASRAIEEIQQLNHDSVIHLKHAKQLISIRDHLVSLQTFLEEFPEKAQPLEGQIQDAANRAGDLIEDVRFNTPNKRSQNIQKAIELIRFVAEEATKVKKDIGEGSDTQLENDPSFVAGSSTTRSTSAVVQDVMAGTFEDDLDAIKSKLCGQSSKLQVVPIFGMGGIGKTTLARKNYDDPLIVEFFDRRAWLTISQDYSLQDVSLRLLGSLDECGAETTQGMSTAEIAKRVYQSLKGRRYLIAIDDIWTTQAWDDMRRMFPDDGNGSRILLTTRMSEVAEYAAGGSSSDYLHQMHFLDPDQSWNLLHEKVFAQERSCPPELEEIGREIARKCGGLPLTIVVVAGILHNTSQTRSAWEKIAGKVNVTVAENDEQVANVLALSYRHLPHRLRPCFLYMSSFPEDYRMPVNQLFRMWMAEGFLKPSGSKSSEKTAEDYLEDLVKRSLVLVAGRKIDGKIGWCSLHDLLRDMCVKRAEEEEFLLLVKDENQNAKNQCRIRTENFSGSFGRKQNRSTPIRTIIQYRYQTEYCDAFPESKFLRVFHTPDLKFKEFPSEVLHLSHLRYLAFYCLSSSLPDEIFKLEKLQTLVLTGGSISLPATIWRMQQLRHLDVSASYGSFSNFVAPLDETLTLENLQTLVRIQNLECTESVLKAIPNIKELRLYYCTGTKLDWSIYQLKNLVHLGKLEILEVEVGELRISGRPESFPFPTTLKKLSLKDCKLPWNALDAVGSCPNLQLLIIDGGCWGRIWETKEEHFPGLKMLQISRTNLHKWIMESSHFPTLERLTLRLCKNLLELPYDLGDIPTLQLIEIVLCNESVVSSAKEIQSDQESMGNDTLQVQCMTPNDYYDRYEG